MGALATMSTQDVVARVLGSSTLGHGDVRVALDAAHASAWVATSPRLLELCRVRIATMLGCDVESEARTPATGLDDDVLGSIARWPTDPRFDALDRACLAFAEMFVIDVASIDDATVEAVRVHLGDAGLLSFVRALLVVEQRIRLRLVWDRLLGGV